MSLRRRLVPALAALAAAAVAVPLVAAPSSAAPAAKKSPPRTYYLVLGDSLGYGYEARLPADLSDGSFDPSAYPGYHEPFAARTAAVTGKVVETVNLSCPGETTTSIVGTACGFATRLGEGTLHDAYPDGQLAAAMRFLVDHKNQVGMISLSLGSNDLNGALGECRVTHDFLADAGNYPAFVACVKAAAPVAGDAMVGNLGTILEALRVAAPTTQIVLFDIYNPQAPLPPLSFTEQLLAPINADLRAMAQERRVLVAGAYDAINGGGALGVCSLTTNCRQAPDIHPTPAGYQALADALWQASGYQRFAG